MQEDNRQQVESQCYFCPKQCQIFLVVDRDQMVRGVKREARQPGYGSRGTEASCHKLKGLVGKHVEKAKAMLRSAKVPKIVVGGH